ncbi:MAG TPA: MFS transporter [Acidobacteriaceae bacterium]|nr:MFS transporter [Acidobacteriaceae bacterium]
MSARKDAGALPEGSSATAVSTPDLPRGARPTRVRHIVLALTVGAYMITYMDRVVISAAVPSIQKEFGFSIVTMGWILSSFQWGYALLQIPGGWLGDRFGPRRALTWIVTWWSVFTSLTTLAWSAASMALVRFLFGMGEAGAFPIATRSLSRWMLPSERGFAQGITHAGSRLGGALTPALVVLILARFGWRAAFLSFGSLGLLWSAVWFWYYRDTPAEHASVNAAERALIQSALAREHRQTNGSAPWKQILESPQMRILCPMYFCYAYNLGVYLVWFPKYLNAHRGFNLEQMGFYASLPLLAGTAGDLLGGSLSDLWAKRSGNLRSARRIVGAAGFLLSAASIVPACLTSDSLTSVGFSCLAMFGLEATVGVSWAITLDIGGDRAGSVSAVMNTCGNIGGATASALSAYLVAFYGWNAPFFVMTALSLLAAFLYLRIDAAKPIFAG